MCAHLLPQGPVEVRGQFSLVSLPLPWGSCEAKGELSQHKQPFLVFELGSHIGQAHLKIYVAKDDPEVTCLLPPLPECWDTGHVEAADLVEMEGSRRCLAPGRLSIPAAHPRFVRLLLVFVLESPR